MPELVNDFFGSYIVFFVLSVLVTTFVLKIRYNKKEDLALKKARAHRDYYITTVSNFYWPAILLISAVVLFFSKPFVWPYLDWAVNKSNIILFAGFAGAIAAFIPYLICGRIIVRKHSWADMEIDED
jgi:uncharacterized membrane protein